MAGRTRKNAILAALAVTGIAILANVPGFWVFARADLTRNSRYSLSEVSRRAVREMDGLDVQVYISRDLPTSMFYKGREIQMKGFDRELLDKLAEYKSWSGGGMRISQVRDNVEEEAKDARLELFTWKDAEIEAGRLEFKKYALGAVFQYRNQMEVLPIVTDPDSLEFEITRILTRLKDKYTRSRSVEPFLEAGRRIQDASRGCNAKLESMLKAQAAGVGAITGMEGGIAEKLTADLHGLSRACSPLGAALSATETVSGRNQQMDALIRSTRLYQDSVDQLVAVLSGKGKGASAEDLSSLVSQVGARYGVLDADAANLLNLPARKSVAFLCSSREFCPFPGTERLIDQAISAQLAEKNPDTKQFLAGVEQIQSQINVINNGMRMGMFENRGLNVIPVSGGQPIPDDVQELVVFGPEMPLSDADRYTVDQFLMSGRSVVVFVNAWDLALFNIDENGNFSQGIPTAPPRLESRPTNISSVLEGYGIRVRGDLVVGRRSFADINLPQMTAGQSGRSSFPYPLLPFFDSMDRTHVLVRNMPGIVLPLATTLDVGKVDRSQSVSRLVSTSSDTASAGGGSLDVMPEKLFAAAHRMGPGPIAPVAVAVSGTFKSAFDKAPESAAGWNLPHRTSGTGRLLVIGSAMGLENLSSEKIFQGFSLTKLTSGLTDPGAEMARYASRFQNWQLRLSQLSPVVAGNMDFIYNCLDWGVMNDTLVDIRSKAADGRPVAQLSAVSAGVLEMMLIAGLPIIFLAFGLIRHRIRRYRP